MTKATPVIEHFGAYKPHPSGEVVDWEAVCDDLNEGETIERVRSLLDWPPWTTLYRITAPSGEEWLYFVAEEQGQ